MAETIRVYLRTNLRYQQESGLILKIRTTVIFGNGIYSGIFANITAETLTCLPDFALLQRGKAGRQGRGENLHFLRGSPPLRLAI